MSTTKRIEISIWLDAVKFDEVKEKNADKYAALDNSTIRIIQLAPKAQVKDRDDKTGVRFLTNAVIETTSTLSASQRTRVIHHISGSLTLCKRA